MIYTARNFRKLALIAGVACAALVGAAPVNAQDKEVFTPEQKAALQEMFKEYLLQNGDVILGSVDEYRRKEEEKTQQSAQENLKQYQEYFASADLPMAGNPKGDVTVVEFFDFNCGYCKRAYADIKTLISEDANVRVVFQEMPILSPASNTMAQIAYAAHKQGKYFEMHGALMDYQGPQTPEDFLALAKSVGVDTAKIEADAASETTKADIDKATKIARDLGIRGTPGFVIGDVIYPGYIGLEGLKSAIAETRAANASKPK